MGYPVTTQKGGGGGHQKVAAADSRKTGPLSLTGNIRWSYVGKSTVSIIPRLGARSGTSQSITKGGCGQNGVERCTILDRARLRSSLHP